MFLDLLGEIARNGSRTEANTCECNIMVVKILNPLPLERPSFIALVVECMCLCMVCLLEATDEGIGDIFAYAFKVFADLAYILLNF